MKENNKGFTLVELLAVIIILSAIALVSVISITKSLYDRDEKECEEQKELARNAAKIYFSINGGSSVTVDKLISDGYLNDKNKTNRLDKSSTISGQSNKYMFNGNCIS